MRRRISHLLAALALVVTAAGPALPDHAGHEEEKRLEYEVKSAFLYNFAKFVEWPDVAFAAAEAALVFCIVGPSPFDDSLDRIVAERTANGRRIDVREIVVPTDLKGCHLVFFPASVDPELARIVHELRVVGQAPALTVGETERFAEALGMIRFVQDEGRIRFDINAVVAERAGLKLSSQLLKLARNVER